MNSELSNSRQLRDELQALTEKIAAAVGSEHSAVVKLMQAADELTATALAEQPRTYGDRPDRN